MKKALATLSISLLGIASTFATEGEAIAAFIAAKYCQPVVATVVASKPQEKPVLRPLVITPVTPDTSKPALVDIAVPQVSDDEVVVSASNVEPQTTTETKSVSDWDDDNDEDDDDDWDNWEDDDDDEDDEDWDNWEDDDDEDDEDE